MDLKQINQFLLEFISLSTPRAIVVVLSFFLILLAITPTEDVKYSPFKSINKHIFPAIYPLECPTEGLFKNCCPSCGLTHAASRFMHLDFKGAKNYNPLIFIVMPTVGYLLLHNSRKWYTRNQT